MRGGETWAADAPAPEARRRHHGQAATATAASGTIALRSSPVGNEAAAAAAAAKDLVESSHHDRSRQVRKRSAFVRKVLREYRRDGTVGESDQRGRGDGGGGGGSDSAAAVATRDSGDPAPLLQAAAGTQQWLQRVLVDLNGLCLALAPSGSGLTYGGEGEVGGHSESQAKLVAGQRVQALSDELSNRGGDVTRLLLACQAIASGASTACCPPSSSSSCSSSLPLPAPNAAASAAATAAARLESSWLLCCNRLDSAVRRLQRSPRPSTGSGSDPAGSRGLWSLSAAAEQPSTPRHVGGVAISRPRRYVPHLSWQYRAVIKSQVRRRRPLPSRRTSRSGSLAGSESSSALGAAADVDDDGWQASPDLPLSPSLQPSSHSGAYDSFGLRCVPGSAQQRSSPGADGRIDCTGDRNRFYDHEAFDGSARIAVGDQAETASERSYHTARGGETDDAAPPDGSDDWLSAASSSSASMGCIGGGAADAASSTPRRGLGSSFAMTRSVAIHEGLSGLASPGPAGDSLAAAAVSAAAAADGNRSFHLFMASGVGTSFAGTGGAASRRGSTRAGGAAAAGSRETSPAFGGDACGSTPCVTPARSRPRRLGPPNVPTLGLVAGNGFGGGAFDSTSLDSPQSCSSLGGRLSPGASPRLQLTDSETSSLSSDFGVSPLSGSLLRAAQDVGPRYDKHELWQAIESNYKYLMGEEIIETCKSTDSDLSLDEEDAKNAVTFTDYLKQYSELMEWLTQIQLFTQRQGSSRSERYLNQTCETGKSYYEEMLERSPRRKLFGDYARRLMRRHPNMKEEINVRLQHLSAQWESLQRTLSPAGAAALIGGSSAAADRAFISSRDTMMRDVEEDLGGMQIWLHDVEAALLPLATRKPSGSVETLQRHLVEHQELQAKIESYNKIVAAVLKLCERLETQHDVSAAAAALQGSSGDPDARESQVVVGASGADGEEGRCEGEIGGGGEAKALHMLAIDFERRWHAVWLQSLEWQCRLEEAINSRAWAQQPGLARLHGDAVSVGDPSSDDNDGDMSPRASVASSSEHSEPDAVEAFQHAMPATAADLRAAGDDADACRSDVNGAPSGECPPPARNSDAASATSPGAEVDQFNNGERATAAAAAAKILLSACASKESSSAVDRHGLRSYYDLGGGLSDTGDEFFIAGSTSRRHPNDGGLHDDDVLDTVPEQFDDALSDDRSSVGSGKGNSFGGDGDGSSFHMPAKARRVDGAWPVAIGGRFVDRLVGGHSDGSSSLGVSPAAMSDFSSHDLSDLDGAGGSGFEPHDRQGHFRGRQAAAAAGLSRYANSEDLSSIVAGAQLQLHDVSPDVAGSCSPATSPLLRWDEAVALEAESADRTDTVNGSAVDATESLSDGGSHTSDSIQQLSNDGQAAVIDAPCSADGKAVVASSVTIAIDAGASMPETLNTGARSSVEANDSAQSPASASFASSSCNSVVYVACLSSTSASPDGTNGERSPLTAVSAAPVTLKDDGDALGQPAAESSAAVVSLSLGFNQGEDGHRLGVGHFGVECTTSKSAAATAAPAAGRSHSPAERASWLAESPAASVPTSSSVGQTDYSVLGGRRGDGAEKAATVEVRIPSVAAGTSCGEVMSLQPVAGQTTAFAPADVQPSEAAATSDRHLKLTALQQTASELTTLQRTAPAACSTPLSHRQRVLGFGSIACTPAATSKSAAAEIHVGDDPVSPMPGRMTTPTQRPDAAAACPLQCLLSPRARVAATGRASHDESRMSRTAPHSLASSSDPLATAAYNQSSDFLYETLPLSPRRKYFHVVQRVPGGDASGSAPSLLGLSQSLGEGQSHLAAESPSYSESVFIDCRAASRAARQHPAVPPLHLDELDVADSSFGAVSAASPLHVTDVSSSIGRPTVGEGALAAPASFVTCTVVDTEPRRRLHASADSVAAPYSGRERPLPDNRWCASTVGSVAKRTSTPPSSVISSTLYVGAVRPADLRANETPPCAASSRSAVVAHIRHPQLPTHQPRLGADSSQRDVSASPAGDLGSSAGKDRRDGSSGDRLPVVVSLSPRFVECAVAAPCNAGSVNNKPPATLTVGDRWVRKFRSEADLWLISTSPSAASPHDDLGRRLQQQQQQEQRCRSSAVWTSEPSAVGAAGQVQLELSPHASADRLSGSHHGAPIVHVFRAASKTATPTRRLQLQVLSPALVACDQSATDAPAAAEDAAAAASLGGTQARAPHPHHQNASVEELSSDDDDDEAAGEGDGRRALAAERLCSPALPKAHLTLTYSISAASISDGGSAAMPLCDEADGDSTAGRVVSYSLPATDAATHRDGDLVEALAPGACPVSDPMLNCPACGDGEGGTVPVPDRHEPVVATAGGGDGASAGVDKPHTESATTRRDGHAASRGSDGDTDVASDDESTINDRSQASSTAAGEGEGAAAVAMATAGDGSSAGHSAPAAAAGAAELREERESSTETVKGSVGSGGRHGTAAAVGAPAVPKSPSAVGGSARAKGGRGSQGGGRRKRKAGKHAAQQKMTVSDNAARDDGAAETSDTVDSTRFQVSAERERAAIEQQPCSFGVEASRGGDSAGAVRKADDDSDSEVAPSAAAAAADLSSVCADESDVVQPPDVSSLSETAWDDYLEKYNTTELEDADDVGSDESLEQLDDGCLQWEDELSSSTGGGGLDDSAADPARGDFGSASGGRLRRGGGLGSKVLRRGSETDDAAFAVVPPTAGGDDDEQSEDSDLEDLHHVIEESSDQLLASERSLKKIRKDPFNYGIGLEPSRYSEVLATCRTNIKCLQVITGHLGTGQGLPNLTDDDIQRMLDLVERWRHLERAAAERERQATALARMSYDISSFRRAVAEAESELSAGAAGVDDSGSGGGFDDVRQLEARVRALQTKRPALLALVGKLSQVDASVSAFETALSRPPAASVPVTGAGVAMSTQLPSVVAAAAASAPATSATERASTAATARAGSSGGNERPPGPRSSVADLQTMHRRCLTSYAERTAELQQHVLLWHQFDENFRDLDYLVGVAEVARSSPATSSDQHCVHDDIAPSSRDGSATAARRHVAGIPSVGAAAACAAHSDGPSSLAAHGQCRRVVGSGAGSEEDEDDVAACERRLSELRSLGGRLAAAAGVTSVGWRSGAESSLAALALRIDRLRRPTAAAPLPQADAEQATAAAVSPLEAEIVEATAASPASCAEAVTAEAVTATAASSGKAARKRAVPVRVPRTAVDVKRKAIGSARQSELAGQRHRTAAAAGGGGVISSSRRRRLPFIIGSWIAVGFLLLLAAWLQPACCDFTRCRRWPWLQALGFDLEPPVGGLPPV